jgi:hypothetical protein
VPVRSGSSPGAPLGGQSTQFLLLLGPKDGAAALDAAELPAPAAGGDVLVVPARDVVHAVVAAVVTVDVAVCAATGARENDETRQRNPV